MTNAIILKVSLIPADKKGTRIKVLNMMTGRQRTISYDHAISAKERVIELLNNYHIPVAMESFAKNNDDFLVIERRYADYIVLFFNGK